MIEGKENDTVIWREEWKNGEECFTWGVRKKIYVLDTFLTSQIDIYQDICSKGLVSILISLNPEFFVAFFDEVKYRYWVKTD